MGNIRKQRELIYFYFLQAEKRISFYEFLCNELSFWEDCNLTTVLWAGQFFIIWIFYCSWVIHKVMPTTVSELFWILAKCFGKKNTISEVHVVTIRPIYIWPVKSGKWLESGTSLTTINIGGQSWSLFAFPLSAIPTK